MGRGGGAREALTRRGRTVALTTLRWGGPGQASLWGAWPGIRWLQEAEGISGDLRTACRYGRWAVRQAVQDARERFSSLPPVELAALLAQQERQVIRAGAALAVLALHAGAELPLTVVVRDRIERASRTLAEAGVFPLPDLQQLGVPLREESTSSCCTGISELGRVWEGLCREALISAQGGFEEVKASVRFLASQVNLPGDAVNRALNLLCALGIAGKVRGSGGRRGDRFVINECDESEVRRRWEALGEPSLAKVNRRRVEEHLGEDVARAVFRRRKAGERIKEVV